MINLKKLAIDCPIIAIFRSRLGIAKPAQPEKEKDKTSGFQVQDASTHFQMPYETGGQRAVYHYWVFNR